MDLFYNELTIEYSPRSSEYPFYKALEKLIKNCMRKAEKYVSTRKLA